MPEKIDFTETKKASFWISQLFIILATVMGVFLAANQGFKQAMEFDNINTHKNNYYLRASLYNELNDNVGYIKEFISKVKAGNSQAVLVLETYIWESMKFSSNTMETPEVLLRHSRRFYREIAEINKTPAASAFYKASQMQKVVDDMEENVLPLFVNDLNELKSLLKKKYNVEIE